MSVIGNRFTHAHKVGLAMLPQNVNNATVNGTAILEPWKQARNLTFIITGADIPVAAVMTGRVQGLLRSDGTTWQDITGLVLTASKLNDGGVADSGVLTAELDLGAMDSTTYMSIRLTLQNTNASNALFGASYVMYDLYAQPSGNVDDLWDTQRAL